MSLNEVFISMDCNSNRRDNHAAFGGGGGVYEGGGGGVKRVEDTDPIILTKLKLLGPT